MAGPATSLGTWPEPNTDPKSGKKGGLCHKAGKDLATTPVNASPKAEMEPKLPTD